MLDVKVLNMNGEEVGTLSLSEAVFGIEPNTVAMHAAVVNYLANRRQGTQSTKTRTEVRGGGRKPWRQKGTGHARQGSTRAPQWTHGGVALGPKPRKYRFTLNKKVRRLAMLSALSCKVAASEMIVLENLELNEIKTKAMVKTLANVGANGKTLIVMPSVNENVIKSAHNIPGVRTALTNTINVYDILNHDNLLITKEAVAKLEEVYSK
ncbi:MAG: 50S ribosomal protein L4 [Oscillospiraceae bacterium]|nr:50S ribosomal protein L4 [Oscillospiraceae bacterium]